MPLLKPNVGRALSAVGALIVVLALFMTWYHIVRPGGETDDTTGWQTFTNLRWVILGGAIVTIATALVRQTRPVLIVRTILGLALAVLILRRIIWPADVEGDVTTEIGVYVSFEVVQVYPNLWRPATAELGRGQRALEPGDDRRR
jgi:hypothetical protein